MITTLKQLTVKFHPELVELLNNKAEEEYTNVSEIIRRAVIFYFRQDN